MRRTKFKAIECEICKKKLLRISNTHLWSAHRITTEDYKQKYPNAPTDAAGLAKSRVSHLTDKTYEEIYGKEKAGQLRDHRHLTTTAQMQDLDQIKRRDGTKLTLSERAKDLLNKEDKRIGWASDRKRGLEYYGLECEKCGLSTEDPGDFVVHHRDICNIKDQMADHTVENLMVLCKPCHIELHHNLDNSLRKWSGIRLVEKGVHFILKGLKNELGLDLHDENFRETPKRVARAYAEIFSGVKNTKEQIDCILNSAFPCEFDSMVIASDIEVFSMCPHHLLPVHYKISAAYIPSKKHGKVIGISKISRIVEILAKRPVLQEQLSTDITDALMRLKGCKGAAAVVDGVHYCMMMRGVKQTLSHTKTSSVRGEFNINASTKGEFMHLITDKK